HPSISSRLVSFFNDPPPTDTYPLSLHDALPICGVARVERRRNPGGGRRGHAGQPGNHPGFACAQPGLRNPTHLAYRSPSRPSGRSEEHTSELQSRSDLVCRLLLEKKNKKRNRLQ